MIEQNLKIIHGLLEDYSSIVKVFNRSPKTHRFLKNVYWIYKEIGTDGQMTVSISYLSHLMEKHEGIGQPPANDDLSRKVNYLCALGFLDKRKGQRTAQNKARNPPNQYIIRELTPETLSIIDQRASILIAHKISIGSMTGKQLKKEGIQVPSFTKNRKLIPLWESIFPCYKEDPEQADRDREILKAIMETLESECSNGKCLSKSELIKIISDSVTGHETIRYPVKATKAVLNAYRKDIGRKFAYGAPTKEDIEKFNLNSKKWIYKPVKPIKPRIRMNKPLQAIQSHLQRDDIVPIFVPSRSGRPFEKMRRCFKWNYFLSRTGEVYSLYDPTITKLQGSVDTEGRLLYSTNFIENELKSITIPSYKLIYICFGNSDYMSIGAKRTLNHSKGDDRPYWQRFLSLEVHHIDGHRDNNNPDNLFLMTKQEHEFLHNRLSQAAHIDYLEALKGNQQ